MILQIQNHYIAIVKLFTDILNNTLQNNIQISLRFEIFTFWEKCEHFIFDVGFEVTEDEIHSFCKL